MVEIPRWVQSSWLGFSLYVGILSSFFPLTNTNKPWFILLVLVLFVGRTLTSGITIALNLYWSRNNPNTTLKIFSSLKINYFWYPFHSLFLVFLKMFSVIFFPSSIFFVQNHCCSHSVKAELFDPTSAYGCTLDDSGAISPSPPSFNSFIM